MPVKDSAGFRRNDPPIETQGTSRRRAPSGVTLNDVARVAGVSTITASRALNNPTIVSDTTVEKVRAAASQIGYVPNLLAGSLKSNRSRLVVVLVPTIAGSPFLRAIQALTDALARAGYQVMMGQIGYDNSHEEALLDAIIGRRPDGIVVTGLITSEAARRKLMMAGIPVVETWQMSAEPLDMLVGFSHYKVGEAMAAYLWERGHRHYVVATGRDVRGQQRLQGFRDKLAAAAGNEGQTSSSIYESYVSLPSTVAAGRQVLSDALGQGLHVDAICCCSDALAVGVLYEAQARGIVVPDELAVLGYGDTEIAPHTVPTMTTVRVDDVGIGLHAARMLIARVEGQTPEQMVVDVGFSIQQRHSA